VYQPVYIRLINKDDIKIEIENYQLNGNLKNYTFSYEVIENGEVTATDTLPAIDLLPLEKKQYSFINQLHFDKNKEVFVTFRFGLSENSLWANKGYVVAWEQFKLTNARNIELPLNKTASVKPAIKADTAYLQSTTKNTSVKLNKKTGLLAEYIVEGDTLIANGMRFNFWRALTDNDRGWGASNKLKVWKTEPDNYTIKSFEYKIGTDNQLNANTLILFNGTQTTAAIHYIINGNGAIKMEVEFNIPDKAPAAPRLGFQMELCNAYNNIKWYGRGPHENYQDRKTSAPFGIFNSTVNEWITPYVRPQENANRGELRWLNLHNGKGKGIQFTADSTSTFSASAWPYTLNTLENTRHNYELKNHNRTTLNIDCIQMGVGGDNSWGMPVHNEYMIYPGKYKFGIYIQRIN